MASKHIDANRAEKLKRVAEVTWEDSRGKHGWTEDVGEFPLPEIRSIGYVMRDDEQGVILTESIDPSTSTTSPYGCSTAIPRSAIRKVKYLRGHR